MEAALDVLGAHARANGAFLDDFHGCGQRAGAQQQRHVGRFLDVGHAADLNASAADFLADHRGRDHLGLSFFDQQDRHALADVLPRGLLEDAGAAAVEGHVHHGLTGLVVQAGAGVGDVVAGQHDVFLDQQRNAVAFDEIFGAERDLAAGSLFQRGGVVLLFVHHTDFQSRGAPQDFLGLGGILHARQLDDHTVEALLLDDRFGDAQFVDAVVQRVHVLLQGEFLDALLRLQVERGVDRQLAAGIVLLQAEVGVVLLDFRLGLGHFRGVLEFQLHGLAVAHHAKIGDALLAHQGAQVADIAFRGLVDGGFHVDLQQEVHAAAQVEAEVHRQRADAAQPFRRARDQVERHRVVLAERAGDRILGLDLDVGVGETRLDAGGIEVKRVIGDAGFLQRGFDLAHQRRLDLHRALGGRHLHRRRFAIEIRQRIEHPDQDGGQDHEVFPQRIAIHGVAPGVG